jgi:hypothetical protein
VTAPHDADAALKDAFQAVAAQSSQECPAADLEKVWEAVTGTLAIEERRDLIDRMATDPALAQAWRVAQELEKARQNDVMLAPRRTAGWLPASLMGLAAALVVAVGAATIYFNRTPADTFRAGGGYAVESLIASDAALPRDAFVLRWKGGPDGSRYAVRVTTEDLTVLTTAAELTAPELTVPRDALAPLASGARVLWQVVLSVPGGETVSSQTFVARVQ